MPLRYPFLVERHNKKGNAHKTEVERLDLKLSWRDLAYAASSALSWLRELAPVFWVKY
jgi:galactitol-specific phosphotransferase system IIC component